MTRSMPLSILVILLTVSAALCGDPALPLHAGPTYVKVEMIDGEGDVATVLGDSLPGATGWAAATRVLTADCEPVLGCYYNTREKAWQGTLKQFEVGAAYWIVLPYGVSEINATLKGVTVTAGLPRTGSGGTMVTIDDGVTKVTPSAPPKSSATHEVVTEKPTSITAGSGVYIQDSPQSGPEMMWVKLPLDTLFTGGKKLEGSVPIPLTGGGIVTVLPPPDFSRPPWQFQK